MAGKPIQLYGKGGLYGWGTNRLIPAATPSQDRKPIPQLQFDFHKLITSRGLAALRDAGMWLMWKFPVVYGAVLEQTELSVGSFVPQFAGTDKGWGEKAEAWLKESDNVFDVRGWPYDRQSYLNGMISAQPVAGAHWTLLTESRSGFPQIQVIGAHRIGGGIDQTVVGNADAFRPPTAMDGNGQPILDSQGNAQLYSGTANPWTGLPCIAGVIVNENGTPVAYRVYDDPPTQAVDISAQSLFPTFSPIQPDQLIGIPSLAVCAFDFLDVNETRDFEKLAQKASAAIGLLETSETGEAPPGAMFDYQNPGAPAQDPAGLQMTSIGGGTYVHLKSGFGKLETLRADRPTQNQREFESNLLRGCFHALEWAMDFTLDTTKNGGAPTRVICEKINRKCLKNQRMAARTMRRVDGYRISKAMKLGLLPWNDEWFKWVYQGPPRITADEKYSSDVAIAKIHNGLSCPQDEIEKEGGAWRKTVVQLVDYQEFLNKECASRNPPINPEKIVWPTPNGPQAAQAAADATKKPTP